MATDIKRCNTSCFLCDRNKFHGTESVKIALFQVTALKIAEWQKVISKPGLHLKSRLCDRHFDEDDIVKGKTIQETFYPYSRWTLKPDAIPSRFLGTSNSPSISHLQNSALVTNDCVHEVDLGTVNKLFKPNVQCHLAIRRLS